MIKELQVISAATDIGTQNLPQDQYVLFLENKLRAAHNLVQVLIKQQQQDVPDEEAYQLGEQLKTILGSMPVEEAQSFMYKNYSPKSLLNIRSISQKIYEVLRLILIEYCNKNNIPVIYQAWEAR